MENEKGQGLAADGGSRITAPTLAQRRVLRADADASPPVLTDEWAWETSADHRYVFLGPEFAEATGLEPAAVLGRSRIEPLRLLAGGDAAEAAHLADIEARRPFRDYLQRLRGGRADCRVVAVSGFPLFDADGGFAGYRGVARNVTRLVEQVERRDGTARSGRGRATVPASQAERMMAALNLMQDAFVYYDDRDRIVLYNDALAAMYRGLEDVIRPGLTLRELVDTGLERGIFDLDGADREEWRRSIFAMRESDGQVSLTLHFSDGRWAMHREMPTGDGGRIGVCTDITALKQRERDLASALERTTIADAVINGIREPIFVKDAELRFVFANEAFASFFDMTPGEIIGKSAIDLLAEEEEAARFEETERRVLQTGEPYEVEENFELDGQTHFRVVRKDRVTLANGKAFVCCFLIDMTALKRREEDAEAARRQLADVIETLPAGVVIYDRDDRFILSNRKIHEALPEIADLMVPGVPLRAVAERAHDVGYFRVSGDADLDALYDTDREAWIEGYLRRYQAEHSVSERQAPDGRWQQVFDTRTPDGLFVGVRVDITELKKRESELREAERRAVLADRAKSEFLANMSHEIRTPMNGVLGMAELLAKTELDAKQKTFTDIIVKSGNALLTIINDILDFSKIDAGQMVLDPVTFNLAEAVEDVATLMSTRAKEKDLELIVRIEPALPRLLVGDVGRFRQIVTNIVGNAVKFTETGHVLIDVSGSVADGAARLRVAVTDTGIGIPRDKLRQVFEKFSQVDSSSTRRHEGTGLGLAITARLVELMGGDIGVESEPGKGSTFHFEISLPVAGESLSQAGAPLDATGARILVIDDNPVNRTILLEQMRSWSFDACAADDGEEGLAVMRAAAALGVRIDCVVLDFQMPGMTGLDVARVIRSTPEIRETPVILLTSVDQTVPGDLHGELGIAAQLIKPTRSSVLLDALVAEIHRNRTARGDRQPPNKAPPPAGPVESRPVNGRTVVPARPVAARSGRRLDILVAEDNEVNQLVFAQILQETDFTYEIVRNGALAVEAHAEMRPGMILMDVSMPEMNGLEATAAIRRAEAGGATRVPIVGVTAHALKGDRERCLASGMDDYLSKPISPGALLEKAERWLGAGAARRSTAR